MQRLLFIILFCFLVEGSGVIQQCSYCVGTCIKCMPGFYGLHCNNKCTDKNCHRFPGKSDTETDEKIDRLLNSSTWSYNCSECKGQCKSCLPGWYGDNCTDKCNNCDVDGCNKITGKCFKCRIGFWGDNCTKHCSRNCSSTIPNESVCDRHTGECLDGCKKGWWENFCNETCSKVCLNGECFYDGMCHCHRGANDDVCLKAERSHVNTDIPFYLYIYFMTWARNGNLCTDELGSVCEGATKLKIRTGENITIL